MPAIKSLAMPFGDLRRRLDQSVVYDWAMRFPIMIYCSFLLGRDVFQFCQQVAHDPVAFQQFDAGTYVAMLARISQWMFVILLSIQPLFRLRPIAKSEEILPRVAALIAVTLPLMYMLLDRAPPNLTFNLVAVVLSVLANVMALVTVSFLGRSLSVMLAELPVGARWQDCGQCERNHCYFQRRWAIPPRRLALGLFGCVHGLRELWPEKSLTPPEEQLAPLVWILLGVRHRNLPIAR